MRRKRLPRDAAATNSGRRRRRDTDVPAVPTFQPEIQTIASQTLKPAATEDDPAEEAVRRMVEAAYT